VSAAAKVLVVGDVIDDIVVRPHGAIAPDTDTAADILPTPGGAGANAAVWLAAAGAEVRFVGRVGAADLARHAMVFRAAGVDARLVPDTRRPTGTIVILVEPDGGRTMLTDRGANLGLCVDDLPDALLDGRDALHLSGYTLFDPEVAAAALDLVGRARGRGLALSVDPASVGFLAAHGPGAFLDAIGHVEVLFPNAAELRLLTGTDDLDVAARALLEVAEVVVVTLGADGALAVDREGGSVRRPALDAEVVDTTGAGDALAGAFLAAHLTGATLEDALARGVAAGARAVTVVGARPA
jgi:sugar/nucleoside kinase (ribokinase family)